MSDEFTSEDVVTDTAGMGRRKVTKRQVIQAALSLVLVVAIFVFVLPQVADFDKVWESIKDMSGPALVALALAGIWNLLTYSFVWMAALPGLTFAQGGVQSEASTAVANTIPGGSYLAIALSYTMLHSWGFRRSIVTLAMLITGIWNNFMKLALPVLAISVLAVTGDATGGRVLVAFFGVAGLVGAVVVFAFALRSEESAARIGNTAARIFTWFLRPFRRLPATGWDIAVTRFRAKVIGLLRTRWHWLTLATLVSHLSLYLVLLVSVRAVGIPESDVNWAELLAVFSFARIVTAIPLTPGGLGVVELALTAGMVAAGGEESEVVAAVLVYRFLTFLPPIPIGVLCYVFWRRNKSWRREALPSPPPEPVAASA